MRARKKPWAQAEFEINNLLIENPEAHKNNWRGYFGGDAPIFLEIGCGKGRFVTESAALNPGVNFLALERERQIIVSGMRRARENNLTNIGFILADVSRLPLFFAENEINKIYINFCDPWPNRKKWARRRLTHKNFLDMYRPILDGRIHFKTDDAELFDFSLGQFSENGWTVENVSRDLHSGKIPEIIMTEYEEKFFNKNIPVMYCEAYYK